MNEKPILFSGSMVRAILAGTKTQTRRVINPQPVMCVPSSRAQVIKGSAYWREIIGELPESIAWHHGGPIHDESHCPYGQPGERLWVKETFQPVQLASEVTQWRYRASDEKGMANWKPSIFMPRKASRITLEIVRVRVERLQDISEDDARAEGVTLRGITRFENECRLEYQILWESINGPGSWALNPWVWVLEFKRVDGRELMVDGKNLTTDEHR